MKTRMLRDIEVSEVGMGCMAFSHGYGKIPPERYSIEAIRGAYEHGCTLFDTAEVYSPNLAGIGHNELIVGKALAPVRDEVVITTKTKFERRDDVRNWVPQLRRENIAGNQPIIDLLAQYAELKGATSAQISLAWMLHKWPNVVPIPGSKNKERILENLDASLVELTDDEFVSLEAALDECVVYGHRGLGGF